MYCMFSVALRVCRCEARCVEVLAGQNTDIGAFTNAELEQCWTLREAVKEDSVLAGAVAGLETGEQAALTTSLIPFLPRLAVHPVGWRVVVALAAAGTTETQHNLVNLLQSHFLQLAECGAGAACLLSCLACLPSPLLVRLGLAGCEVAARLTGPHSARLLRACLPLLLHSCHSRQLDTLLDLLCRPAEAKQLPRWPDPAPSLSFWSSGVFRQHRESLIASSTGKEWNSRLSRKMNLNN